MRAKLLKTVKNSNVIRYDIILSSSRPDEEDILKSMNMAWGIPIWLKGKWAESPEEVFLKAKVKLSDDEQEESLDANGPSQETERNTVFQNRKSAKLDFSQWPHLATLLPGKRSDKFQCACGWRSKNKKLDRKHKKNCTYLLSLAPLFARVRQYEIRHGLRHESKTVEKAKEVERSGKRKRHRVERRNRRGKKAHKGS